MTHQTCVLYLYNDLSLIHEPEIGYNFTTSKPNLIGIATGSGAIISKVDLPFAESGFVGVGQVIPHIF
jgi:hypothetical protein